ncbi:elongation factor 4 [candidate division WWE3 bacterium RIFCSPLOWO2_01_FULL_37_15]|uniref:Elongation factor 4 n=1 Tax=candidate division WWE3 bacterium RIFCSPLOWO2_01_FULL_37_15 TaxID=1802622 RepID=A0A1F4UYG7_UNCKA|nr:MAG: elongation factor 4 [candidate division WWE3 bacterium RIFCSPLOWO2_01_FULL_37_15]
MTLNQVSQQNIRDFCIIAHVDHGKSTLADRLLEITHTIDKRHLKEQFLDSMDLEREKGITIKLKSVRMYYKLPFQTIQQNQARKHKEDFQKTQAVLAESTNLQTYQLNLIDTPGHVDFSYEVSRSLAACEGAILVVDVTQGIQAQTISNIYKALDADLKIIPVLNKVDLPGAEIEKTAEDLCRTFGFNSEDILKVSAKTGEGVEDLLREIIKRIPAPQGDTSPAATPRALIYDTFYDDFLGVVASIKVVDGTFSSHNPQIKFLATKAVSTFQEIGIFTPLRKKLDRLITGEVGYIATGLKDIHAVRVGDTITPANAQNVELLPGYKEVKPFVFVSIFPIDNDKFPELREALEKLSLSDSSLSFEPEASNALGFGFRCGFLGLLHAEIIQERLEREYDLELISTIPTVEYKIDKTDGSQVSVKAASDFPDTTQIKEIQEPWIKLNLVAPSEYVGSIITLCDKRRGVMLKMDYPTENRVVFEYELPLAELVYNFFDDLKTLSSGFASLDYDFSRYKKVNAVKLNVLVHGEEIEPLSHIVLKDKAEDFGRELLKKLKGVIPRQQFQVALQAAIGGKVLAREDIPAMRKNVLAKMSGGHRERKDKLLEIQKKGKQRMKRLGKVDIPQEAFRQVLSA